MQNEEVKPMYVCVDQNSLRSQEILRLVAETATEFVFPDAALMEMCKSDKWESTLRRSLGSLAKIPERVHYARGNGDLMSSERSLKRPLRPEDLIDPVATTFLRQLLGEVGRNALAGPNITLLRRNWVERRNAMADGHLNHEQNAASLRSLVPTIRDRLSAKTLVRFRAGKLDEHERISIVSGISSSIFVHVLRDGGMDFNVANALLESKSFLARHLWLRVYAIVRWIELGGYESASPERVTNDLVDSHYVLVGSYFDQLVTSDCDAAAADFSLRTALKRDFDWNIDLSYLLEINDQTAMPNC